MYHNSEILLLMIITAWPPSLPDLSLRVMGNKKSYYVGLMYWKSTCNRDATTYRLQAVRLLFGFCHLKPQFQLVNSFVHVINFFLSLMTNLISSYQNIPAKRYNLNGYTSDYGTCLVKLKLLPSLCNL